MAIAVTTLTPLKYGFVINATSGDASGAEVLLAAPTSGSIILDHLTINNGANAISITIGEDTNAGGVVHTLIGPIAMAANTSIQFMFPYGISLTALHALTVDASGAGAICIFAQGRYTG
jgi:hypothetical protein